MVFTAVFYALQFVKAACILSVLNIRVLATELGQGHVVTSCAVSVENCTCVVANTTSNSLILDCRAQNISDIPNLVPFSGQTFDEILLTSNQIDRLTKNAFLGPQIKSINLDNNHIALIFDNTLRISTGLEEISMRNCSLHKWPKVLSKLTTLRRINLANNQIKAITVTQFISLRDLEYLNLRDNQIELISGTNDFTTFVELIELDLSNNNLYINPIELFGKLPSLIKLSLSNNELHTVTNTSFENSQKLEYLDLGQNELSISADVYPFDIIQNLKTLLLSTCRIERFTKRLFLYNDQIQTLAISGCKLDEIESNALTDLKNLDTIDVSEFDFKTAQELLDGFESRIVDLSLCSMNLTEVPTTFLKRFTNVHRINMNRNQITHLQQHVFVDLSQPEVEINLDDNHIVYVSPDALKGMTSHLKLSLAGNDITSLSFLTEHGCDWDRRQIDLSRNPLVCACADVAALQRKLVVFKGECVLEVSINSTLVNYLDKEDTRNIPKTFNIKQNVYNNNKNDLAILEKLCNLKPRKFEKYSCCVNDWVTGNSSITCPSQPSLSSGNVIMAHTMITLLWLFACKLLID